jgi:hypothetical protein
MYSLMTRRCVPARCNSTTPPANDLARTLFGDPILVMTGIGADAPAHRVPGATASGALQGRAEEVVFAPEFHFATGSGDIPPAHEPGGA